MATKKRAAAEPKRAAPAKKATPEHKLPKEVIDAREFFGFDPTPQGHARGVAEVEARALLQLYRRHDNGAFFWLAFQELRRASVPVPEPMLKTLDKMAAGLLAARGTPKERLASIARAVGMTAAKGGGGRQGNAHADIVLATRSIVEAVHQRIGLKKSDTAVYAEVARRFEGRWGRATGRSLTDRGVKGMFKNWIKAQAKKP